MPKEQRNEGKGMGNKQHKWQAENRQGEVKNTIGNIEAKEFICMTYGHELRWEECGWEGIKGAKWDKKMFY